MSDSVERKGVDKQLGNCNNEEEPDLITFEEEPDLISFEDVPMVPSFVKAGTKKKTKSWNNRRVFWDNKYAYEWMCYDKKVRPGLNIFNDEGEELEWDFEHDTRFYKNGHQEDGDEECSDPPKKRVRCAVRGRGSVRFGGDLELDKPCTEHKSKPKKVQAEHVEQPAKENPTEKLWNHDMWKANLHK